MRTLAKEKRLRELQESFETGIISKEEHEKQRKVIEEMKEEKNEEIKIPENVEEQGKIKPKISSDKILIISALLLLLVFIVVFSFTVFNKEQPKTLEEMHLLNLKGKLKSEQGYLYNKAYSFIKFDNLWYMQLTSPSGKRLYNMALRYGPKDLENIKIKGRLNTTLFDNSSEYYVTFNPKGNDFSHVALAVSDFNQHMTNVFFKMPIAACDRNETYSCETRPIITCENINKLVLYVKEANETNVYYNNNCIVVEGNGFELVKGIDRVLLNIYGIMGQ